MKMIPFIIGIGSGYVFALLLTVIGTVAGVPELCVLDWSSIVNCFSPFTFESIFSIPGFTVVEGIKTGFSAIDGAAIGNIAVAFAPVAFVVLAEHIADHKNISSIIERDLLKDPGLTRTLLGDGVGSMVGAIFGGCPNTTYGESVGCVAITKNASIITIFAAAIGCIVLSFFSPFVAVINSIPKCVMGGACVALYGFIAVSGLQMLKNVDLGDTKNLFVVSSILVCGIGGLVINIDIGAANPLTITNVATALILGILVNTMLSAGKKANTHESVENLSVVSEEENK
jgi:uracil permease